jgi:ABC-type multidrug transport system fused ATPase/permease subunit
MLRLPPGFFDPSTGSVAIGVDVREFTLKSPRRQIAIAPHCQ